MKADFIKNRKFLRKLFLLPIVFYLSCTTPKNQSNKIILTQVNDKEISVAEFLNSSEFTIRSNNLRAKNPSLKNLIAEKILAWEAEQKDHESLTSIFQGKLKDADRYVIYDALWAIEKYLNDNVNDSLKFQMLELPFTKPEIDFKYPFFHC